MADLAMQCGLGNSYCNLHGQIKGTSVPILPLLCNECSINDDVILVPMQPVMES